MSTILNVYVEDEIVGFFRVNDNPRQYWLDLIDAMSKNAKLIDISDMNPMPVIGMEYIEENFSIPENSNLVFVSNNLTPDQKKFAFIVDSKFVVDQILFIDIMPQFIAAYLSSPRFEIISNPEVIEEK